MRPLPAFHGTPIAGGREVGFLSGEFGDRFLEIYLDFLQCYRKRYEDHYSLRRLDVLTVADDEVLGSSPYAAVAAERILRKFAAPGENLRLGQPPDVAAVLRGHECGLDMSDHYVDLGLVLVGTAETIPWAKPCTCWLDDRTPYHKELGAAAGGFGGVDDIGSEFEFGDSDLGSTSTIIGTAEFGYSLTLEEKLLQEVGAVTGEELSLENGTNASGEPRLPLLMSPRCMALCWRKGRDWDLSFEYRGGELLHCSTLCQSGCFKLADLDDATGMPTEVCEGKGQAHLVGVTRPGPNRFVFKGIHWGDPNSLVNVSLGLDESNQYGRLVVVKESSSQRQGAKSKVTVFHPPAKRPRPQTAPAAPAAPRPRPVGSSRDPQAG